MTAINRHYQAMIYRTLSTLLIALSLTACGGETAPKTTTSVTPERPAVTPVKAERTPMERGRIMYKRCRACHTLEEGGKHKVGPNLWNIYGMKAGSKEGFAYSKVMEASEVVWDTETMDGYVKKPKDFMTGNKMSFVGIKKDEDRAALQEYLRAETTPTP